LALPPRSRAIPVNFTVGSTSFRVSLGTLAGLAIGLWLFFRFGQEGGAAVDAALSRFQAGGAQEVASQKAYQARQDSLRRLLDASRAHYRALQQDSAALYVALSRPVPPTDTTPKVTQAACFEVISNCEARVQAWKQKADWDSAGWAEAVVRLNHSDSLVSLGVTASKCSLLHLGPIHAFGCPDRLMAFKVGVGTGGALAVLLYIALHR